MIISPGRGYIFVHIPKTGGTAMALALEARAMKDDLMLGDTPKALRRRRRLAEASARGRLWKHSTLADIEGLLSREQIAGMFCFTLVRNPWDRVVSYYHWLREQGFDHPAVTLAKQVDFPVFLADPATQATLRSNPAARYMQNSDGAAYPAHYLRLEHLPEDMAPLARHLGFSPSLDRVNASPRETDYRRYYDDEAAGLIETLCAEDIARFGYRFDPT
ncbi:sulfotransferase family 2 domain-containing protein [Mesobacterium pallidum]|uniref:sulfotransferase family 2 domain-containing protein n=1 Tax=Mesobacterium pallidum TaxID=2872037 RepID=UPI001EE328FE|nr:sulfotransferase family 2 domain-containing protein [Mesobacterium pallidum]